jgi:hypothetical protein
VGDPCKEVACTKCGTKWIKKKEKITWAQKDNRITHILAEEVEHEDEFEILPGSPMTFLVVGSLGLS